MEKITGKPIPKSTPNRRPLTYPFDTLEIGDCLLLSPEESEDKKKVVSFVNSAYQYGKRTNKKFKRAKDANKQIGIWRIS